MKKKKNLNAVFFVENTEINYSHSFNDNYFRNLPMCRARHNNAESIFPQVIVEVIFILGILLMAAPLIAFAEEKSPALLGIQVTTTLAKSATWAVSIPAQGEVLPWEVAILSAKTNGVGATEVAVVEGDSVRKGQVLARFDDRLLRAELAQAKANLALATANSQNAATNLKRVAQLRLKQALSEQEFDLIATQAATAAATREQATAALTLAEIKLADATITAPDAGKILERKLELGQVPQSGDSLFRLLRQHKLEWVAQIDAADLTRVKPNMAAQIKLANPSSSVNQTLLTGKVRSVSPQLTNSSRLAKVRVVLDGAPELPVNTYAEGSILIGNAAAIIVPANCLVIKDGKTWVFRVKTIANNANANNLSAEQVLVSLGRRQQQDIEIVAGINVGDVLVQEGAGFLNHGDKLSVKASAAASSSAPAAAKTGAK